MKTKHTRPTRQWEPAVFRTGLGAAIGIFPVAGAVALVWGDDLNAELLARIVGLVAAAALLLAALAALAAYRRQATYLRAAERAAAMRRHPSTPFNQDQEAGR